MPSEPTLGLQYDLELNNKYREGRGMSFGKKITRILYEHHRGPPFNISRCGYTSESLESIPILWHADNSVLLVLVCAFSVDPEL